MSRTADKSVSIPFRIFSALIFGLWLWMFLPPMQELKLINDAESFSLVFLGLVIGQMTPWRWLRFVLALVVTELYMSQYFGQGHGVIGGLMDIHGVEVGQIRDAFHQMGTSLTDPLQTHVFLWCVCAMFWLIAYAGSKRRLWIFYNILAIVVLAIVDGNTNVHPNQQIVVLLILFVANLGMLHYRKLLGHFQKTATPTARYFTPLVTLVAVCMVVGLALPKAGPVWADPSQVFATWAGNHTGHTVQMIGYQEDNSQLGGSFMQNNEPVLTMVSKYPARLRGKVYSVYSGKGWGTDYTQYADVPVGESFAQYALNPALLPGKTVTQKITVLTANLHAQAVFGAYSAEKVAGLNLPTGNLLQVAAESDEAYASPLPQGTTYTVTSYEINNPYATLEKLPDLPSIPANAFPPEIRRTYTMLPNVPARVHQLAVQVAGKTHNEYQMVTNIRDFLRLNYTYDTQNIPVPQGNQDYVDQFLFQTKRGYCNNFSSAMAVMLRTLGIPTRWVTGFAEGTEDTHYKGADSRYIYKNSDAHSWVEVYFPNVGWIPFDPTPGFTLSYPPADVNSQGTTPNSPTQQPTPDKQPLHSWKDPTAAVSTSTSHSFPWGAIVRGLLWTLLCLAVVALIALFFLRNHLRQWRWRWMWRHLTPRGMVRGLLALIHALQLVGELPRRAVTLRDLHKAAKTYGVTDSEYKQLVQTAESHWYGGKAPSPEDLDKVRQTWLSWILRIGRK